MHVLAGPNGSGKSTFVHEILGPTTRLPFVNADEIARATWPGEEERRAYDASALAARARADAIAHGRSFITETVFSHPSKLDLLVEAAASGYQVELHVMLVPVDLSVLRVAYRVTQGGHTVPETKIRERHARLWDLVGRAAVVATRADFYDNTRAATPFRRVAAFQRGRLLHADWPRWTPAALRSALP